MLCMSAIKEASSHGLSVVQYNAMWVGQSQWGRTVPGSSGSALLAVLLKLWEPCTRPGLSRRLSLALLAIVQSEKACPMI